MSPRTRHCNEKLRSYPKTLRAIAHWIESKRTGILTPNQQRVLGFWKKSDGLCEICKGYIPHPLKQTEQMNEYNMPTLDHILPASKGGTRLWKNLRLAHRYCNMMRGNKED